MSEDNRDQRGGHPMRKSDMKSCECCPILSPPAKDRNRSRRNRTAVKHERAAEERR